MRTVGVVLLALRRLRSRLGLTLLSLVAVTLAVGIATGVPIFAQGVSFLVLREELQELSRRAQRPPLAVRFYYLASEEGPLPMQGVDEMERIITEVLVEEVRLPLKQVVTLVESPKLIMRPSSGSSSYSDLRNPGLKPVSLAVLDQVAGHIAMVEGESFGQSRPVNRLAVWVHEAVCNEMGLQVGEGYDLFRTTGGTLPVYIAGVWREVNRHDPYWFGPPATEFAGAFLVSRTAYEESAEPLFPERTGFASWYFIWEENGLVLERVDASARGLRRAANIISARLPGIRMDYSPLEPLRGYQERRATLSILLVSFSLPAMGLTLYFFSLLSTLTVFYQREETAILASRGFGQLLILGLAFTESLVVVAGGCPLGILLGWGLARLMGYSHSFLTFIGRPALPASVVGLDWRLLAGGLAMLLVARLVPASRAARESVVTQRRQRTGRVLGSGLVKVVVDVLVIALAVFSYQQLRQRGALGIIGWRPSGDPFHDPLILLAPTIFVFGISLVVAHLFPVIIRPLDSLSGRLGSFAGHLGLRQFARESERYSSVLFLVLVCLSLGALYASMARSLDRWLRDGVYYSVGADYTFKHGEPPVVGPLFGASKSPVSGASVGGGWLLPVSDYLTIPGVERATRVGEFEAKPNVPGARSGRLLGIDRLDFSEVAHFRPDFASVPLGELLNRLGMKQNGLLVSHQFMEANDLLEGQRLLFQIGSPPVEVQFVVVGTFDFFPTMRPGKAEVFVANLEYVFGQTGGISPHFIWLKTEPGTDYQKMVERLEGMGVIVTRQEDARSRIAQGEERVERVGLFGVLSAGFLAGSLLSCIGLLLYTYASLHERLAQLNLLRAIGAERREILIMVGIEYAGLVAFGILVGTLVGVVASHLFVPFLQLDTNPEPGTPLLLPEIAWGQIGRTAIVFAGAFVICQLLVLYRASRKDTFEILRLG